MRKVFEKGIKAKPFSCFFFKKNNFWCNANTIWLIRVKERSSYLHSIDSINVIILPKDANINFISKHIKCDLIYIFY
jgi:hypothetical protein